MSPQQHIEAIAADCHVGIGSKTLEPDKSLRLLKELCGVLLEQEDRLQALESVPVVTNLPDHVESRPHTDADVTRRDRRKGQ